MPLIEEIEESEANVLGNVRSSEDTAVTPGVAVNMSSCRAVPGHEVVSSPASVLWRVLSLAFPGGLRLEPLAVAIRSPDVVCLRSECLLAASLTECSSIPGYNSSVELPRNIQASVRYKYLLARPLSSH